MKVVNFSDLAGLRHCVGEDAVDIEMNQFLRGNLPLYVVRFGLWALKTGGILRLHAPSTYDSICYEPGRWTFQLLVQLVCKGSSDLAVLELCDLSSRTLVLKRTQPPLEMGPWSAAVMFSGEVSELKSLEHCLAGLMTQKGLRNDGQIVVCGPAAAASLVSGHPGVEYLPYETPSQAGRFLIGEKKNFAVRALKNERVLVCHTRVALRDGCLDALPQEFDIITPSVWVQGDHATLPYLDLHFFSTSSAAIVSGWPQPPSHYNRETWLERTGRRFPYIDGGLYCIRRSLAIAHPLSNVVAWGEGEDAEWALRLLHAGHVVELSQDAHADSMTCKIPRYARWGHLSLYRRLSSAIQYPRAALNVILTTLRAS